MVKPEEPLFKAGGTFAGYRIFRVLSADALSGIHVFSARRASELRIDAPCVLYCRRAGAEPAPIEIAEHAKAVERLKALSLPELPEVFGGGFSEGVFWVAVQDVRGPALKDLIQERGVDNHWPIESCLRLVANIARVLKTAADHGILHLSVNPKRVHCTPDLELQTITGLGILQLFKQKLPPLSNAVDLPYLAPEQISKLPDVDAKTDVYALGMMFFELCTLEVPFTDNHGFLPGDFITQAIMTVTPEPMKYRRKGTPDFVEAFLHRLVRKSVDQRPGWADVITEADEAAAEYERWRKRAAGEEPTGKEPMGKEPTGEEHTEEEPIDKEPIGEEHTEEEPGAEERSPPRWRIVPAITTAALCILLGVFLARLVPDRVDVASPSLGNRPVQPSAPAAVESPAPAAVEPPAPATVEPPAPAAVKPPAPAAVKPPARTAIKPPARTAIKPPARTAIKPPAPASVQQPAIVEPPDAEPVLHSQTLQHAPSATPPPLSLDAIQSLYSFRSRRKDPLRDED